MNMSQTPPAQVSSLNLPFMTVERFCYDGRNPPLEETHGGEYAFVVQIQLIEVMAQRITCAGREVYNGDVPERSVSIRDLRENWTGEFRFTFDRISFRIGFDDLREYAAEAGRPEFTLLRCGEGFHDASLYGLAQALIPALARPRQTSQLFLEQMGLATLAHLTQTYGGLHFPAQRKGGLSARQEARATEFLSAQLSGEFSLTDLAEACGLSRSYFSKAFKKTFGKTPYRWLTEYRVAKACEFLRSDMPISQVALACGFTDQSHLTRVFSSIMRETPGNWRRSSHNAGPPPRDLASAPGREIMF
ncbi:AraC family transcriptional regulator [Mesorhizobium sp.]|uniref:helix-turn-helix domain-containing protein n=1 Tax=Mesorhizobium sp. TaxID=1871066 RepID=UPI0025D522DA|nr:AraC family transcriptional regulator [Mesorhizobium sp.]